MLSFKEVRDIIQKRYSLNIAEASENAKCFLDESYKFKSEQDVINTLEALEKQGQE